MEQTRAVVIVALVPPPTVHVVFPPSFLVQNGGPVLDVTRPPKGLRAARGDGRADDTEALRDDFDWLRAKYKAGDGFDPEFHYTLFFPDGTYRVTDTLIYRGPTVGAYPKWDGTFDIDHLHLLGASREGARIRLDDNAPGFGDSARPKAVLALQHPDTVFNNVPGSNWVRNLTIAVGAGNPGAAGLYLQGANNTEMSDLTVRAAPGSGRFGVWCRVGSIQGYYHDVRVDGFDVGYRQEPNAEAQTAWERLEMKGQRDVGLSLAGGGLALRRVQIDAAPGRPAIRMEGGGTQLVAIESILRGTGGADAVERPTAVERSAFLRDLRTPGFERALGPAAGAYRTSLWPTPEPSPIEPRDAPQAPWGVPARDWAVVDDYPSVQAAFDAGRSIVVFRKRRYRLPGDVRVPAGVSVVRGMAAAVEGGAFVVAEAGGPITFEETSAPIRIEAPRDVVQRRAGNGISNPRALPVSVFLENVNDVATGDAFCPAGSTVYARGLDVEYANAEQIVVNGGRMWLFGFKTENATSTPFVVRAAGRLEALGGYFNVTNAPTPATQRPMIDLQDAGPTSLTFFTNLNGTGRDGAWDRVVRERRGATIRELRRAAVPRRGGGYADDLAVSRYVGGL